MDCTIEIDPLGLPGLLLRDPNGIRILNPFNEDSILTFGPTDECRIRAEARSGMIFEDPGAFSFNNPQEPGAAQMFVDGTMFANEFVQLSSGQYKTEVEPITGALELVESLRGVSFDWDGLNDGRHDVGFIAEEVAKVLPELVRTDENGNAMGVAYHRLTAVTVEAIKAQQDQIEQLESERDELHARLARIEAAMAELSNRAD